MDLAVARHGRVEGIEEATEFACAMEWWHSPITRPVRTSFSSMTSNSGH